MQSRAESIVLFMIELKTRGQYAYVQFYHALNASGQEHLSKFLLPGLPKDYQKYTNEAMRTVGSNIHE